MRNMMKNEGNEARRIDLFQCQIWDPFPILGVIPISQIGSTVASFRWIFHLNSVHTSRTL